MRIPCFKVDNSTELFFRNMIALEQQCCQVNPKYYTDYARLMSHLVKGNKDITFLRKNGTIHNLLGEDGKVAYMFNNLSVEIDTSTNFYFASVYTAVNGLCRNRRKEKRKHKSLVQVENLSSAGQHNASAQLHRAPLVAARPASEDDVALPLWSRRQAASQAFSRRFRFRRPQAGEGPEEACRHHQDGVVSVFSNDVDAYYEKLLAGESGIRHHIDRFDASKFPTRFGGQIPQNKRLDDSGRKLSELMESGREHLFDLINDQPTICEVLKEKKPVKRKCNTNIGSKSKTNFKNVLKDRTLAIRSLVPEIDGRLMEIAGKMERLMLEELDEMDKQIKNPVYSNIYTTEREADLWKVEIWCTELVLGGVKPLTEWVDENKYIFLIGGNDLKWVKAFHSKVMQVVSLNPQLAIMISYIGSNMKVASTILQDNICEALGSPGDSLFVWARLQSTFLSRIKFLDQTCCDEDHDEIVGGLKKILAYEAKDFAVDGWAMLCKGNEIVVCDLGDKMLTVMNEYEKWKVSAIAKGFDQAFKDHHEMLTSIYASKHPLCCALDYPCNFDKVPENAKCPQCCHNMQKFVTFRCHHDIVGDEDSDYEDFD
nr:protein SIEVE ELEMENT OCCLUSION B-like [Ipomoea batatas]